MPVSCLISRPFCQICLRDRKQDWKNICLRGEQDRRISTKILLGAVSFKGWDATWTKHLSQITGVPQDAVLVMVENNDGVMVRCWTRLPIAHVPCRHKIKRGKRACGEEGVDGTSGQSQLMSLVPVSLFIYPVAPLLSWFPWPGFCLPPSFPSFLL